jgi:hypothetical protein
MMAGISTDRLAEQLVHAGNADHPAEPVQVTQ